jgi:hypothetical protein
MDKVDKYIDDLFHQKFSGAGATEPVSGGDWTQLSKVIRKKNFWCFSTGSFNVYYLTAIVATITTIGSFVFPNIIGNDKDESLLPPQSIEIRDSLQSKDSIPNGCGSSSVIEKQVQKEKCLKVCTEKGLIKAQGATTEPQPVKEITNEEPSVPKEQQGDSMAKKIDTGSINEVENNIERLTPQEIAPADTIIQIDTIRIQKKGVQFKRKKDVF